MALKPGRVGVAPSQVDLFGNILGGGSGGDGYTKAEADAKFLAQTDAASTYETKSSASATYETKSNASATYETKTNAAATYETKTNAAATYAAKTDLDGWSTTSLVQSDNTVTFTGLDDSYAYDLYCIDKLIGISSISKTGSGSNITLVYTVTGATAGDSCKLRIVK